LVFPSSSYGPWLMLWYLQSFLGVRCHARPMFQNRDHI
jgi:hypothetical protein